MLSPKARPLTASEPVVSLGGPLSAPTEPLPLRLLPWARPVADFVALAGAVPLAFLFRYGWNLLAAQDDPVQVSSHLAVSVGWVVASIGALYSNRLYDEDTLFTGGGELSRVVKSLVESVGVLSIVVFLMHLIAVSRGWFGFLVLFSLLLLVADRLAFRFVLRRLRARGALRRRAIIVAAETSRNGGFTDRLAPEFEVVTRLAPRDALDALTASDLRVDARRTRPVLIVDETDVDEDDLWRIVLAAGESGFSVYVRSAVRPVARDRFTMRQIGGHTMMRVAPPALRGARAFQKRAFDVVVSATLLLVTSPLIMLIALGTLVTSGLPVFFGQERVGQRGRTFVLWKFRTMRRDAEKDTGPVWAEGDDPRRTPIGRLLRRTSLDELPQLWNVLKGDMSVVGPRPERPAFVDRFTEEVPWYAYRHRIRPGITGWAQAHGLRGNTSLDPRVEHDNWYIENWSIPLDVKIIALTLRELIAGRNAY